MSTETPDLRADARYVIAYCEDACVSLPSGPCHFENAAIRVAEALLERLGDPPISRPEGERSDHD